MSTTDNTASASPELEATKTPAQPKRTNSIDMLHGPLLGKLIIFAVPLALSSIISQLFNHSSERNTRHYLGIEQEDLDKVVRNFKLE